MPKTIRKNMSKIITLDLLEFMKIDNVGSHLQLEKSRTNLTF